MKISKQDLTMLYMVLNIITVAYSKIQAFLCSFLLFELVLLCVTSRPSNLTKIFEGQQIIRALMK